ncbi:MAG: hypothetical protein ACLQBX_13480 [Candidatus Limnocylindrales bacterium]
MQAARDELAKASTDDAGRNEVLLSIGLEVRREAESSLAEAETQARALVDAARRSVAARVAAATEVADGTAREEAARMVNEARRRLVHRRAELDAGRMDEVFEAAAHRLDEIASGCDPERWARALQVLTREACERAGMGATVEVRVCDVALVDPVFATGAPVAGPLPDPGVRVRSADGRGEVDATLAARLARARSAMGDQVAATLGLGVAGLVPPPPTPGGAAPSGEA